MRKTVFLAMTIGSLSAQEPPLSYPDSKPGRTVETLHGVEVPDPYRWLEDLNSDQTADWVKAQSSLTDAYLEAIPGRKALEDHLTKLWNVERFGVPFFEGGRYFFSKNDGLQNQSVLYSTKSLDTAPAILLDPNTLSSDGTVALSSYEVSPDGRYLAYSTSASGSDWVEWRIREISSGKDLPDHLKWSKFSGASWAKNSKGFYYGRFPAPKDGEEMMAQNIHKKIFFHEIGKPQNEDRLVYERPEHPKQG
ncbi:S9 family peptidase, partial [Akkermansiaceae bacterium]|nr:S9 family peptidase [Akkermansiaceae bacterium]